MEDAVSEVVIVVIAGVLAFLMCATMLFGAVAGMVDFFRRLFGKKARFGCAFYLGVILFSPLIILVMEDEKSQTGIIWFGLTLICFIPALILTGVGWVRRRTNAQLRQLSAAPVSVSSPAPKPPRPEPTLDIRHPARPPLSARPEPTLDAGEPTAPDPRPPQLPPLRQAGATPWYVKLGAFQGVWFVGWIAAFLMLGSNDFFGASHALWWLWSAVLFLSLILPFVFPAFWIAWRQRRLRKKVSPGSALCTNCAFVRGSVFRGLTPGVAYVTEGTFYLVPIFAGEQIAVQVAGIRDFKLKHLPIRHIAFSTAEYGRIVMLVRRAKPWLRYLDGYAMNGERL